MPGNLLTILKFKCFKYTYKLYKIFLMLIQPQKRQDKLLCVVTANISGVLLKKCLFLAHETIIFWVKLLRWVARGPLLSRVILGLRLYVNPASMITSATGRACGKSSCFLPQARHNSVTHISLINQV